MTQTETHFMYSPGGEHENSNATPYSDDSKKDYGEEPPKTKKEGKSFLKRIKEALQDWSNDDKRAMDFDETKPIT